jgi:cytochrome c-type biogenesis protein CcmH
MTGFVIGAALCALVAVAMLLWPGLRTRKHSGTKPVLTTIAVSLVALSVAVALYLHLSKPAWNAPPATTTAMSEAVALRDAANQSPQDGKAWLRLGNAYLKLEQFALAARAYERGNRLLNHQDADGLNGLAESLALDGDGTNDAQVEALFNRALQLNPRSPKALLYTALSALHDGRLTVARDRFSAILSLGDAPTDVRAALQKQIAAIDSQLQPPVVDARTSVHLHVTVAAAIQSAFEDAVRKGANLFVFVRGAAGGPPLAVKRLAASLPVDVDLGAADAMLAGNAIQPGQAVSVVARLSISGSPTAQPGDLSGELRSRAGVGQRLELVISQRVQ